MTAVRAPGVVVAALLVAMLGGCSGDDRPTDWTLRSPPDGNVLELRVAVGSSSCNEFAGLDVREREDEVRIIARLDRTGGPDCTADDSVHDVDVELGEPLDDRELTGCHPRNSVNPRFESAGRDCTAVGAPEG
ncbi:MAG TPA: hypothetical protein VFK43_16390 [Acidimicrobiales bacterium]|nr:hypothetical protein [Acidimicrobiales bacterium]